MLPNEFLWEVILVKKEKTKSKVKGGILMRI